MKDWQKELLFMASFVVAGAVLAWIIFFAGRE